MARYKFEVEVVVTGTATEIHEVDMPDGLTHEEAVRLCQEKWDRNESECVEHADYHVAELDTTGEGSMDETTVMLVPDEDETEDDVVSIPVVEISRLRETGAPALTIHLCDGTTVSISQSVGWHFNQPDTFDGYYLEYEGGEYGPLKTTDELLPKLDQLTGKRFVIR